MAKNQVTLTFAGDSSKLEQAFDKVGTSSKQMSDDVGKSSRDIGDGIDNTGQKAGDMESGFRGVTDSMSGFSQIAQGDVMGGLTDLAGGAEALATGFSGVVVPALKKTIGRLGQTRVGMAATTVATKVMAAAQKVLNAVMRANPLGLIITALILIGTALVVAYKKSSTFRRIVQGAMRGVQKAFGWVLDRGKKLLGWFKDLPGKIGGFFGGLADVIKKPFTSAFDAIRSFWNRTAGGFGFSIPGWVPKIGGNSFRIPKMHTGGVMGGAPGTEGLALLQAGERVTPAGASGGATVIEIRSGGSRMDDLLVELLSRAIRVRGGNVQAVLGG